MARASLVSLMRPTLVGCRLQLFAYPLEGSLQALPHHPVEATGDRRAHEGSRRLISDPQLDPHAVRDLFEGETALLADWAGFRDPSNLGRPLPPIQAQYALERQAQHHHLDVVAGPEASRFRPGRLPFADSVEHSRDVAVVGEVVEHAL